MLSKITYNTFRHSTAYSDTAIIIKNNIWHHEIHNFKKDFLQVIRN
jgi:hypothetical protein